MPLGCGCSLKLALYLGCGCPLDITQRILPNTTTFPHCYTADPTLTLPNLCKALEVVKNWFGYSGLGSYLDIPSSKLEEIRRLYSNPAQYQRVLLHHWLTTHPAPTWVLVGEALYKKEKHIIMRNVLDTYVRGRFEYISCSLSNHVLRTTCCSDNY